MDQKQTLVIIPIPLMHTPLFADYSQAFVPGKLKSFLADLYSGKLHREFHYGPDPETTEEPALVC